MVYLFHRIKGFMVMIHWDDPGWLDSKLKIIMNIFVKVDGENESAYVFLHQYKISYGSSVIVAEIIIIIKINGGMKVTHRTLKMC